MAMLLVHLAWLVSLAGCNHASSIEHTESSYKGSFYVYPYQQRVRLSSLDNSVSTTIGQHADNSKLVGVDYDFASGMVYVVDEAAATITASNSTHTLLVVSRLNKPKGVAFDWLNSTLYWTEERAIHYCRVNADFVCHPSTLVSASSGSPRAIAVDPYRQELYWSETGDSPRIVSLALRDGAYTQKVLMSRQLKKPTALTVEHSTGHVYWADPEMPALGCIGCQNKRHIFVQFGKNLRYQPFSVSVFNGKVYFFNKRKQLDKTHSFYSLPTAKWTHIYNTRDCNEGKCSVTVSPKKELTLSSGNNYVFDFLIANVTVKVSVKNIASSSSPPATTKVSTTESPTSASAVLSTARSSSWSSPTLSLSSSSVIPTEMTDKLKTESEDFWVSLHPGILAAAAAIICAMLLTIVLVVATIVCRKRKFNRGNTNKGFSSLDRTSPTGSEYEHPVAVAPAVAPQFPIAGVQAEPPQYADIMSIPGTHDLVPIDIANPTYTGETAPPLASISEQQARQAEKKAVNHTQNLVMKDPANLTNPNYDAVIEIDQVNDISKDSLHAPIPAHHYNNLVCAGNTCRVGHSNTSLPPPPPPPPIYDTPADQSPHSTTTVSTTTQSSQSTESQSNSEYETTYRLQIPQTPQCTQTI